MTKAFDKNWLCHYPWSLKCIHNNGQEFIRVEFQDMFESYGIQSKLTMVKNPNNISEDFAVNLCKKSLLHHAIFCKWDSQNSMWLIQRHHFHPLHHSSSFKVIFDLWIDPFTEIKIQKVHGEVYHMPIIRFL